MGLEVGQKLEKFACRQLKSAQSAEDRNLQRTVGSMEMLEGTGMGVY